MIIGQPTAGKGALFEEQKLSSGQTLRYAVAQISLADGIPLWGKPVTPDLGPTINDQVEKHAPRMIGTTTSPMSFEESPPRHRLSEATLVQSQDPEWDAYLVSLEKKPGDKTTPPPIVRDIALIDAMDSLKAIQLSQRPAAKQPKSDASPQTSSSLE